LTFQLDILRLMTLGFCRSRRGANGSARISATAWWRAVWMLWGGKSRLGAG
jgi:hypothetical protein